LLWNLDALRGIEAMPSAGIPVDCACSHSVSDRMD
jgi:hypothetical protein